jgi:hypothetical protein
MEDRRLQLINGCSIKAITTSLIDEPAGLVSYVRQSYGQQISEERATEYRDKLINDVYPEWRNYLARRGVKSTR